MNPIPLGPAAAPPGRTVTRAPERDAVDSPLRMPVHRRVLGRTKPEPGFDNDVIVDQRAYVQRLDGSRQPG